MSNCNNFKVEYQSADCCKQLIENSEHLFMITERELRSIIFAVLQKQTDLSPWNRAVEYIEELKNK